MKTVLVLAAVFAMACAREFEDIVRAEVQRMIDNPCGFDHHYHCDPLTTRDCYIQCDEMFRLLVANDERESDAYCAKWCICLIDGVCAPDATTSAPYTTPPAPTMTTI